MKKRPNVVFLLTDDQRYGTIRALGNDEIKTSNLDRLVYFGTSFVNAHIPGGTASAVCMPSRAMINSGKTLFHLEDCGRNIPDNHVTMGQCFLNNGYHAMETGKWHNGVKSFARSFDGGENIFFGGMWDHWNVPVNDFDETGKYEKEIPFTPNFSADSQVINVRAQKINAGYHSTELFADSAVQYIEEYDSEQPFFMYVSFLAPHDPRTMPKGFRKMYDESEISLPPNYAEMPTVNFGWASGRDETVEAYPRKPENIKKHIADYYAMISQIDYHVGRIMQALEKKGEMDNTIIVLAGDNGLAIGQHGLMGKQNIFEHSVCVPLFMAGPGIPQDKIDKRYVYLLDVYPTLCELCGLNIPGTVDGKSFAKMFTDDRFVSRDALYLAFHSRMRGVVENGYKLIEYRTNELKLTQLFNLKDDPMETNNLFGVQGYEQITAHLREKMFALRDEWEDEKDELGAHFWAQWRKYEEAALPNMGGPKGASMKNQVSDWGTDKK